MSSDYENKDFSQVSREMMEEAPNIIQNNVTACISAISNFKWKKIKIIIPKQPTPSQRPRLCGSRIYVPGAAKNASYFNKNILPQLKDLFITTPCRVKADMFLETPMSFSKTQKILAEMRVLRPWTHVGDIDNFLKSILDMIQPNEKRKHRGIMVDDCLVVDITSGKFYSKEPRYELTISYIDKKSVNDKIAKILRMDSFIYQEPKM